MRISDWSSDVCSSDLFIPALSAIDAGVVPLNVRDCDRQRADGFHVDELDVQGCRWLVLWAELPTPQRVDAFEDGLMAYARARHAAGVFPRPPAARLYGVRHALADHRVGPGCGPPNPAGNA